MRQPSTKEVPNTVLAMLLLYKTRQTDLLISTVSIHTPSYLW